MLLLATGTCARGGSRGRFLLAGILLSLASGAAADGVSGVVYQRRGDRVAPMPGVTVVVRVAEGGDTLAITKSDGQGRYHVASVPPGRIVLGAGKPGYLTKRAGGAAESHVVVDCARENACAHVDFELFKAGSVAGQVVDEFGDPLEGIAVSVRSSAASGRRVEGNDVRHSRTDDRGIFRVTDLESGEYAIQAAESAAGFPHDVAYKSAIITAKVEEGRESGGLRLVMRPAARHHVAGIISGVNLSAPAKAVLEARPSAGSSGSSAHGWSTGVAVSEDGRFDFRSVPQGRYDLTLRYHPKGDRAETRIRLSRLEVDRDLEGLILTPQQATRVTITVRPPSPATLSRFPLHVSMGGETTERVLTAGLPELRIELDDLVPGTYRIRSPSSDYYLAGIVAEGQFRAAHEFVLHEGGVLRLEVVLRADFGHVAGRVTASRQTSGTPGPRYRVALARGPEVRWVTSDQAGGFVFLKVPPGEYQIGAWTLRAEEEASGDVLWKTAGPAVRTISVRPADVVGVDLEPAR